MLAWLLNLLGMPILTKVFDTITGVFAKYQDTQLGKYKVDGKVDLGILQTAVALRQAEASILVAEQGHWFTRSMRPLGALPFWIFLWKVIVWDKVLGDYTHGSTDPLDPHMWQVFMVVVGAYYGSDAVLQYLRGRK